MSQNIRNTPFTINSVNSSIINQNVQENASSEVNNITEIAQQNIQQVSHSVSEGNIKDKNISKKNESIEKVCLSQEEIAHDFSEYRWAMAEHINKNRDLNFQDEYGDTALMQIIGLGELELVVKFIKKGANVNLQNKDGQTALMYAIIQGYIDIAIELINEGAAVDLSDKNKETALMYAVRKGYKEIVFALLDKGADINAQDKYGDTPVSIALDTEQQDIVIEFVNRGLVDINARDTNGKTRLMRSSNVNEALILLNAGADMNSQDNNGRTALMQVPKEIFIELIRRGANVNIKDNSGATVLSAACLIESTKYKVLEIIEKRSVDILSNLFTEFNKELRYLIEGSFMTLLLEKLDFELKINPDNEDLLINLVKLLQKISQEIIDIGHNSNIRLKWEESEKRLIEILRSKFGDYIRFLSREELAKQNSYLWKNTRSLRANMHQAQKKSKFTDIDIVFS